MIIPGTDNAMARQIKLMGEYIPSNSPATDDAIIMDKLNTEDWTDVATSLAVSICLLTAACNKVTNGPNESPHKKKAKCPIPIDLPNIRKITIETISKANIDMVSNLKCLSVYFMASNTEIKDPIPKNSKALSTPPAS